MDTDPCLYEGPYKPSTNIYWEKKPDFLANFDPNQVNMFRVILSPNFVGSVEEAKALDVGAPDLYSL